MTANPLYFKELSACLRKLSAEDREEAVHYYQEYAEEAGISSREELTERFGTPRMLAAGIYAESAKKQIHPETGQKAHIGKGLAISLAALFSMPVTAAAGGILFGLAAACLAIAFSMLVTLAALGGSSVWMLIRSFSFLSPFEAELWLSSLGGALLMAALTAGAVLFLIFVSKIILKNAAIITANFTAGRSKK